MRIEDFFNIIIYGCSDWVHAFFLYFFFLVSLSVSISLPRPVFSTEYIYWANEVTSSEKYQFLLSILSNIIIMCLIHATYLPVTEAIGIKEKKNNITSW